METSIWGARPFCFIVGMAFVIYGGVKAIVESEKGCHDTSIKARMERLTAELWATDITLFGVVLLICSR